MNMQKIVSFIPNLFTLGNLFCGCLAIVYAFHWDLNMAAVLVFTAAFLDFFDGFFARILKIQGELGKQLDSLADMVSFGLVPGIVMYQFLNYAFMVNDNSAEPNGGVNWLASIALLIPLFSCYRLAKFNIDARQAHGFIGLPTPANAIFFVSLSLVITQLFWMMPFDNLVTNTLTSPAIENEENIQNYIADIWAGGNVYETTSSLPLLTEHLRWIIDSSSVLSFLFNPWTLILVIILFSILMVSEIPLFALKFKNFGWKANKIRYVFLILSLVMLILFWFIAIPFIIILYLLLSMVNNILKITE